MNGLLLRIAQRVWSDWAAIDERDQQRLLVDLAICLVSLPLVVISLGLLAAVTDLGQVRAQAPALVVVLVLGYAFSELSFFRTTSTRTGEFSYDSTNLGSVLLVSALLLLGPVAIWPYVFLTVFYRVSRLLKLSRALRWNWLRNQLFNIWSTTLSALAALAIYRTVGGQIPLPGMSLADVAPAFVAVTVWIALNSALLWLLLLVLARLASRLRNKPGSVAYRDSAGFFVLSETPAYFGIMAAGLYSLAGPGAYLFFMAGVILASLLARRLSQAAMMGQQRSRDVELVQQLGRAIIDGPPDASTLPDLLADFVPRMFPHRQIEIRLFPDQTLLRKPDQCMALPDALWTWQRGHPGYQVIDPGSSLPWSDHAQPHRYLLNPIVSPEQADPIGGICLVQDGSYALDKPVDLQPALQALAAQIASTLRSADGFRRTLEHQKMAQELAVAGQIQASFLPVSLPELDGWQLAASLLPARETSGDFYDAFPLPNGKLGLLVADVSDKGMGAALYMALTRTLLRTYAHEYHTRPDYVLRVSNRRILTDTQAGLFVSAFYAVLDPFSGTLTYANAGHCPALLARRNQDALQRLPRTGMVLGVLEGGTWEQESITLTPGDALVLFSDGVTDAQNPQAEFFGEDRLAAIVAAHQGRSAQQIEEAIRFAVRHFTGDAPRFDDIALMVLGRNLSPVV